jgi:hypothetical protein
MKKVISLATSFLLGFAFFIAGGAVASETTTPSPESVAVEAPANAPEGPEAAEEVTVEETQQVEPAVESTVADIPYCFNVGKGSESGGDCTCVQDAVSDIAEIDCLVASGIIPASDYEAYRKIILGN